MSKFTRLLKTLYFKAYIRFLALRWVFQVNLGDEVVHLGRVRTVSNGVSPMSWTLLDPYEQGVLRSECRKVWSWKNVAHSFRSGANFYEGYWLSIWVDKGIEPWVRALNIWPGRKA